MHDAATVSDLKQFLPRIPLFGGLPEPTLDAFIASMERLSFKAGDAVVRQGEPGREMYVIRSGEVAVAHQTREGEWVRMVRLGEGEFFGEMSLIDIQKRSSSVVVEKPAVLFRLTTQAWYQLYQSDVSGYVMFLQNLCRELSRRLRKADARLAELAQGEEITQIRDAR